jgi:hypothetical protein
MDALTVHRPSLHEHRPPWPIPALSSRAYILAEFMTFTKKYLHFNLDLYTMPLRASCMRPLARHLRRCSDVCASRRANFRLADGVTMERPVYLLDAEGVLSGLITTFGEPFPARFPTSSSLKIKTHRRCSFVTIGLSFPPHANAAVGLFGPVVGLLRLYSPHQRATTSAQWPQRRPSNPRISLLPLLAISDVCSDSLLKERFPGPKLSTRSQIS